MSVLPVFAVFSILPATLPACKPAPPLPAAPPAQAPSRAPSGPSAGPDVSLDPAQIVATVNGEPIKAGALDAEVGKEIRGAAREFVSKVYELRQRALEELIAKRAFELEAKATGRSVEELTEKEIDDRVQPPGEEEIKAFYERFVKGQYPATLAQAHDQIREQLVEQAHVARRQAYVESLKKKYNASIALAPPRVEVAATGPSRGPATAKVTIVEFSDFQCPFCSRAKETVDEVMEAYGDKIRLVFRNFPLGFHDKAAGAAKAGLCAADQGQFWPMHDRMFSHQDKLGTEELKAGAKALGLDTARFDRCLDSDEKAAALAKDKADGEAAGVSGTPAFFVNGRLLSGAQPVEAFRQIIDAELAR